MRKLTRSLMAGTLCLFAPRAWAGKTFTDVPKNHWAFDEVHWLRADGMLEGWGGKFYGNKKFTRYEMATVLTRYMKKYDTEKERVEGELDKLRVEDSRQQSQIKELYGKTDDLESRMAALDGRRSKPPALRPSGGDESLASTFERQLDPVVVVPVPRARDPRLELVDPTPRPRSIEPPPVVAPPAPLEPAVSLEEMARQAVIDSAPPPVIDSSPRQQETLQEQIARLRNRIKSRQRSRGEVPSPTVAPVVQERTPAPEQTPEVSALPSGSRLSANGSEDELPAEDLERLRTIRQRFMKEMKLRMQMSEVDVGNQAGNSEPGLPSVGLTDAGLADQL